MVKPLEVGRLMAPLFFAVKSWTWEVHVRFVPRVPVFWSWGNQEFCTTAGCLHVFHLLVLHNFLPSFHKLAELFSSSFFFQSRLQRSIPSVHHHCSIIIFNVASSLYHHHRVLVSVHVHQHPTAPQRCLQRSIINVPSSSRASVHIRQYTTAPHPIPPPHSIFSAASST